MLNNIIERLNQRIAVGNIFDKIYGLSELVESDSGKKWATYIGNGQLQHVTGFDAQQGTLFWGKRGRFNINRVDSFRTAGCQVAYDTRMLLTAYAVVRKSHLPCDSADAADWVASRIYKLISGYDQQFKTALKVVGYEVIPSGYTSDIRSLPDNYEYAKVAVDIDVSVITHSSDACYDICETGDIPLPDFQPCTPCLTQVAVDGETIIGNGTPDDPLVALGGGGGGSLRIQDEGATVSNAATTINFTGDGVTASLVSPGVVQVNVPGGSGGGAVDSVNGQTGVVSLDTDDIPDTATNRYTNDTDISRLANTSGTNTGDQDLSGLVPYTGAANDVDLGSNGLTSETLVVNKPSGSGVAASITKGGNGEALTVVKSSGSGNAASITGGVTLLDELHLNTDLSDTYIASAATWNAKQAPLTAGTGISLAGDIVTNTAPDQTVVLNAGDGIQVTGTYPNFTIVNTKGKLFKSNTDGADRVSNTLTLSSSQEIPAGWASVGNTIRITSFFRMTGVGNTKTARIYINTTNNLSGSPVLIGTYTSVAGALSIALERHPRIKGATDTEVFPVASSVPSDVVQGAAMASLNIDWSQTLYIIFAVQVVNTGDNMLCSGYMIEQI